MNARLQRRIQRYGWDKAAAGYEQTWSAQLAPAQRALLARAALRPGERVLDVACGTGLVTLAAADAVGPSGRVVGVDLSEEMVVRAGAAARTRGLDHVLVDRMDAEALAVPDEAFDAALCALGLMYVPNAAQAVAEMARAIVPGGRCVAAVWGRRHACGWSELFPIVDAHVQSEVCPLFFALGAPDRLGTLFRQAGLCDVTAERLDVQLTWDSADAACAAAFEGGPVALAFSRFDIETRLAVEAAYLRSLKSWRIGDRYAVPGEFVIVTGRKPV